MIPSPAQAQEAATGAAPNTATVAADGTAAAGTAAPQQPSPIVTLLPMLLIFLIFYFLVIRPQQRRMREHQEMLKQIKPKDRVSIGGGLLGKVVRLHGEDELEIEVADGLRVRALRSGVALLSVPADAKPAAAPAAAAPANLSKPGDAG